MNDNKSLSQDVCRSDVHENRSRETDMQVRMDLIMPRFYSFLPPLCLPFSTPLHSWKESSQQQWVGKRCNNQDAQHGSSSLLTVCNTVSVLPVSVSNSICKHSPFCDTNIVFPGILWSFINLSGWSIKHTLVVNEALSPWTRVWITVKGTDWRFHYRPQWHGRSLNHSTQSVGIHRQIDTQKHSMRRIYAAVALILTETSLTKPNTSSLYKPKPVLLRWCNSV